MKSPEISARCMMCGQNHLIDPEHKDYKKISEAQRTPAFICALCSNKVRYESDDKKKNPKPI